MSDTETTRRPPSASTGFEAEVRRYQGLVYSVAYAILANAEETLDVLQEVFVKAFAEPRFLDDRFGRKAWLVRVTRNLALNARRDLLRRVRNLLRIGVRMPTEYRPDYTEFLEREESRAELRRAIERLTLEEREILALRFGADYSYRQIAVELDLPIGTVMSRLSRIKEKVGIALPEEPES